MQGLRRLEDRKGEVDITSLKEIMCFIFKCRVLICCNMKTPLCTSAHFLSRQNFIMKTPTYQVLPFWPARLAWPAWQHPQSALQVDEEKQGGGGTFDIHKIYDMVHIGYIIHVIHNICNDTI